MAVPKLSIPILTDFQAQSPARQLMEALSLGEIKKDYSEVKIAEANRNRTIAADLIANHNADELFKPESESLGRNVLHYAIFAKDTENALALINKKNAMPDQDGKQTGVTPDQLFQQDKFGVTALHKAIEKANYNVEKEYDKDKEKKAEKARKAMNEVSLALIEIGNSDHVFTPDTHGFTPLHRAIEQGNQEIALALVKKTGVTNEHLQKTTKYTNKTALMMAEETQMDDVAAAIRNAIANKEKLVPESIQEVVPQPQYTQLKLVPTRG